MLLRSSVSETSVPPVRGVVGRDSGNSKARGKLGRIMFSSGSRRRTATNQTWSVSYTRQRRHPQILKLYYVRFRWTRKRRTCFASYEITVSSWISHRTFFILHTRTFSFYTSKRFSFSFYPSRLGSSNFILLDRDLCRWSRTDITVYFQRPS